MHDLRNFTLPELEELVTKKGQPKFRAKQLYSGIYKGNTDLRQIKSIPATFLSELRKSCVIGNVNPERRQNSSLDGTEKFLFALNDGNKIESVFMKYKYGNSLCISSQAGCRMGCAFCASGLDGLARNLTAGEMISQVLETERITGEKVSRIVVMGTGEPFDNYEALSRFIKIMNDPNGRKMGMRNLTVSTCGIVPVMYEFAKDFPQVNLAVSLHASTDKARGVMMPINRKYPVDELIEAAKNYTHTTRRRITFEYALICGVNDDGESIGELADLLSGLLCHVNLIPLNPVTERNFKSSGRRRAKQIAAYLNENGIPATVRRQLGLDISGACGQLRLSDSKGENISKPI